MIASFFQRLEASGVEYLLISGQATILYGAATFSEDVDIWLSPTQRNLERFISVLRASQARYYKLTPPLVLEHLERGHGFHFVLPDDQGPEVYLDVMGKPPRVGAFAAATAGARFFETDFGRVRTVGIPELVEIKKTQRPVDYPIIGRLVLAYLDDPTVSKSELDYRWALDNTFNLTEFRALVREHHDVYQALAPSLPDPVRRALDELGRSSALSVALEDELDTWLETRSSALRRADRRYWRDIIDELRALRRENKLMPEGTTV